MVRRRSGDTTGPTGKSSTRHEGVGPRGEVEALLRSTLDALSAHIAVLDRTGTIVAVNRGVAILRPRTGFVGRDAGVGMNYLAVCERSRRHIAGRRADRRGAARHHRAGAGRSSAWSIPARARTGCVGSSCG